ncbi:MAG: arylsulfatase A-like enzyme [Limisphaerales bacterium]|jgi:arylsulfatase A-like enzyme
MNRTGILAAVLLAAGLSVQAAPARPNIVLIMADDVGIDGLSCYGSDTYQTPHLDRLAASGMRFTHAYSQPLCTPTRVQIMTGKYNHRNWTYFGILDTQERTFGHLLQDAGYRTCIVGKWQLHSYDPPDFPNADRRRGTGMRVDRAGFEEQTLYHSWHTEDKGSRYANATTFQNGKLRKELKGQYGPDISVDAMLDFMKRHREEPMFVYFPMALPHWPMVPTPDSKEWQDPSRRLEETIRYFPDMVHYMDKLVGRIAKGIDTLGLTDNTIVLFYSDNGTHLKVSSTLKGKIVQGGKATPAQTGIRVPLIASWPGKIKPGQINSDLIDASDFLPTLADLGKTRIPKDWHTDGHSFAPQLFGKTGTKRDWCFFWYDPRPGWDKNRFSRHIFALDHKYKLFSDGRMFDIRGTEMREKALDLKRLTPAAKAARTKLQKAIKQTMQPPISAHAKIVVDAFGNRVD